MTDDLNFVLRARREKLDAIRAEGIEPFAYSFNRSHSAADALAMWPDADAASQHDAGAAATVSHADSESEATRVSVAGRIVAWRAHGKTTFAHLADSSG